MKDRRKYMKGDRYCYRQTRTQTRGHVFKMTLLMIRAQNPRKYSKVHFGGFAVVDYCKFCNGCGEGLRLLYGLYV